MPTTSATRAYDESLRAGPGQAPNMAGGALAVREEPRWQRQWRDMQAKVRPAQTGVCAALLVPGALPLSATAAIVLRHGDKDTSLHA